MDSKETKKVYAALFEVQKKLYEKGGYIEKSEKNPFLKNKYIPLPKLLRHIVPLLHAHGLMLTQKNLPSLESGGANILSTVVHVESGEYVTSNCTPPPMIQVEYEDKAKTIKIEKITPQSLGGSITYARRYDLESMFAIPTTDDDGNAASGYSKPDPAPSKPIDFWAVVTERTGIENLTVKKVREILKTVGVETDDQLRKLTSPEAEKIIKEKINE